MCIYKLSICRDVPVAFKQNSFGCLRVIFFHFYFAYLRTFAAYTRSLQFQVEVTKALNIHKHIVHDCKFDGEMSECV